MHSLNNIIVLFFIIRWCEFRPSYYLKFFFFFLRYNVSAEIITSKEINVWTVLFSDTDTHHFWPICYFSIYCFSHYCCLFLYVHISFIYLLVQNLLNRLRGIWNEEVNRTVSHLAWVGYNSILTFPFIPRFD